MNLVFFTHPAFLGHQSMPRFAKMLEDGMKRRGHNVVMWSPRARLFALPAPGALKKWLGYIDQYLLFPIEVRNRIKNTVPDSLFIFSDNALGPWVPMVERQFHVIHCHDFLAQKAALGQIPENATSWTGGLYQKFIRRGYSRGKNFISVSKKTQEDLHQFLGFKPSVSEVVYNGLNQLFTPQDPTMARGQVGSRVGLDLADGYLLHVGGNHWYKNRAGIIEIYLAWRASTSKKLPLLIIGDAPTDELLDTYSSSPFKSDIYWRSGIEDEFVRLAYSGASLFLFPSYAEGFGWPIAEAMASGCPVVTTNEAPMTEVAGDAGFLIPRRPNDEQQAVHWASDAARVVGKILSLGKEERDAVIEAGIKNARRFETEHALDRIESIYESIVGDVKVPSGSKTNLTSTIKK